MILLAGGLLAFMLFTALVVDVGTWYHRKAQTQACADLAAETSLGSVDQKQTLAEQTAYVVAAAQQVITANGYDAAQWTISTAPNTDAPPATYVAEITVSTTQILPTFFWNAITRNTPRMAVLAVAQADKRKSQLPPCSYLSTTMANFQAGHDRVFDSWDSRKGDYKPTNVGGGVNYDGAENVGCTNYDNHLQNHDFHFGSLYSAGSLDAHGNSYIAGDINAARDVKAGGSTVLGNVYAGQDVPRWVLPPAQAPSDIAVNNDDGNIRVYDKKNPLKSSAFTGTALIDTSKNQKWSSIHVPAGGKYYFTAVDLNTPIVIDGDPLVAGPTRFFLSGDTFNFHSIQFATTLSVPGAGLGTVGGGALQILGLTPGWIDINAGSKNVADVYAPDMDFSMESGAHLFGRIWSRRIDFKGAAYFTYDKALDPPPDPALYFVRAHLVR